MRNDSFSGIPKVLWWGVLPWHIGDVVRKLRESYRDGTHPDGLNRKELADKAGIRPSTLGELERNVSNFEQGTLAKVAIALNVTVDGLYAQLPGAASAPTADPVDLETFARFQQLTREQKEAIRRLIDQFGLFADRQRAYPDKDDDQEPPQSAPRSGT